MNTFSRYILRGFMFQFALLLIGFTALLQLFDLLNNSTDILDKHEGSLSALAEYALLRLPEIASFLIPFVVLMAALVTLGRMERSNEIMAYKAAGAPYFNVLWAFLPAVGIVAVLHFILADRIVPVSIQAMITRDLTTEKKKQHSDGTTDPLFVQDGDSITEAGIVGEDGATLGKLRIFFRDGAGNIAKQIFAEEARYDAEDQRWHLSNVWTTVILPGKAAQTSHSDAADWDTRLTPAEFSDLIEKPQAMTLGKIWGFISTTQVGVRPTYFYATWLQKRIALPVSSILMILLAAPVSHSLRRRERGLALGMTYGFGLGFLYFLTDGLVLSLGESGAVPPFLAAWLPILLFAAIGGAWLIRQEGY